MTRNITKLITFNEARKPQYNASCKLELDLLSNTLKIYPKNENFNDITAIFDWKFIRSKNILFVFANLDLQDFVLVFKNEEICIKVWNGIFKNRVADSVEEDFLKERFLNPLYKNASKNWRIKEILEEWIQKFNEKEKNEYLTLLKWHQKNPEMNDEEENEIKDVKVKIEPPPEKSRKRKHHEIDTNDLFDSVNAFDQSNFDGHGDCCDDNEFHECPPKKHDYSNRFTKIIYNSKFEIVNSKTENGFCRKLLMFTASDRKECYEFTFFRRKQFFHHRCRDYLKGIKAILGVDENGKECLKMEDKKHQCFPILYEPEKYSELEIVKKPDFEILENCASQSKSKKMLIIFDSNDRSQCYEYFWSLTQKAFYCRGCVSKGKRWISAEIIRENTEDESILFSKEEHICKKRKYSPEKYFSSNAIVTSPNFEIQINIQNGSERKTLIIFNENDRKFCYSYFWWNHGNRYICSGCSRKQTRVSAKICKNDENEEYVILSNLKHVCSPRKYVPQNEIIILRPPNIKFMEANEERKSKLFIFDSTDPTLCYVFSQHGNDKRYRCLGCDSVVSQQKYRNQNQSHRTNKDTRTKCNQTKQNVTVYLGKDDGPNGEYFVEIDGGEKHICQPKKYEPEKYDPEKYERKILQPKIDYIMFREKRKNGNINLLVFHPNDKKLCYKYYCNKAKISFNCSACSTKKTTVSAKLHQDSDGNEYLKTNQNKHVCTPIKYSSVIKRDTVILEKSGFDFEEPKKKEEEIDENRIVRLPNFELQRNRFGVPERRLIIFTEDDPKLCYDYRYDTCKFVCKKCNASAKIQSDEENNTKKYVILSKNKHKCEPVKYEPEKKMIESNESENGTSNFMVFNRDDENKQAKFVIFTSSTKEMCYEYSYHKQSKTFRCLGCKALNKIMSAKLVKDDGKECVQLLKNEHVCTPKKFILEEFQPKIIPENGFKLCSNKKGKPNSKLILFDSEKDGFVYEYYLEKNNFFICYQCTYKNTSVSAKLFEKENGEKYLELSSTKHVCESKNYEVPCEPKVTSNFVIHFNGSGIPASRLTVLNDNDKSIGYQYSFIKSSNLYQCLGCKSKKKILTAKLITDNEGNQFLRFGKIEHVCIVRNLKEEKLYFDDFKFEENGNILITNDPIQKNQFYKFAYDEKLGTFCCSKCFEKKKKYTTATICKENDEKEFVLLNVPHCCTSFVQ